MEPNALGYICPPETSHTNHLIDVRTFLEKRDRIRAEFERRRQLGLPTPSLSDLDQVLSQGGG